MTEIKSNALVIAEKDLGENDKLLTLLVERYGKVVAVCKGAKIVFSSEPFQPLGILELLRKHEVTVFGNTPTMMTMFSKFVKKNDFLNLKMLSISGECVTEGMAKTIRNSNMPDRGVNNFSAPEVSQDASNILNSPFSELVICFINCFSYSKSLFF